MKMKIVSSFKLKTELHTLDSLIQMELPMAIVPCLQIDIIFKKKTNHKKFNKKNCIML